MRYIRYIYALKLVPESLEAEMHFCNFLPKKKKELFFFRKHPFFGKSRSLSFLFINIQILTFLLLKPLNGFCLSFLGFCNFSYFEGTFFSLQKKCKKVHKTEAVETDF